MRIGVSSNVVVAAASLIGCSILTAPFNYLGVKVGCNMSRITSWDDVISKNGGLGVSSFFAHNRALLFKWFWRFLTDGLSLWTRFIKAIFGTKKDLDTHILRRSIWPDAILAIHSLQSKGINLMDFIQKKVGIDDNTSFWDDSWLGEVALKVLYKRLSALEMCKSISVADKMSHPSLSHSFCRMPRGGVEQENYGLLFSKVANLVLPNISDRWWWSLEGSQEFLVKSSSILIDNTILPKAEVPTRWLKVVPIKVNVYACRVCLDKLPTRANLLLRGTDIPSIACPELEDVAFNSYNEWLNWIVNICLHKTLKVFLEGDGNCRFRSVVVGLGRDENMWPLIRQELLQELSYESRGGTTSKDEEFGRRVWVEVVDAVDVGGGVYADGGAGGVKSREGSSESIYVKA
uniref:RNA-directed DNA polymerase, eukaryota, reverse transcriptase zinc-binding domain protein n=1 Tax=Tanacetum cinerariifolium TaxID=118510 RepID=A0A6L2LNV7_TANCI|nr:RNA-directed DNA polymerase, eukaryota, reverse transcriptase zinc-binding domain protein [Tanacetum cinerariifolium]